jgi:hypothetical protein
MARAKKKKVEVPADRTTADSKEKSENDDFQ